MRSICRVCLYFYCGGRQVSGIEPQSMYAYRSQNEKASFALTVLLRPIPDLCRVDRRRSQVRLLRLPPRRAHMSHIPKPTIWSLYRTFRRQINLLPSEYLRFVFHHMCSQTEFDINLGSSSELNSRMMCVTSSLLLMATQGCSGPNSSVFRG